MGITRLSAYRGTPNTLRPLSRSPYQAGAPHTETVKEGVVLFFRELLDSLVNIHIYELGHEEIGNGKKLAGIGEYHLSQATELV